MTTTTSQPAWIEACIEAARERAERDAAEARVRQDEERQREAALLAARIELVLGHTIRLDDLPYVSGILFLLTEEGSTFRRHLRIAATCPTCDRGWRSGCLNTHADVGVALRQRQAFLVGETHVCDLRPRDEDGELICADEPRPTPPTPTPEQRLVAALHDLVHQVIEGTV